MASYFCVGFTASFIATPLSVYMVKELGELLTLGKEKRQQKEYKVPSGAEPQLVLCLTSISLPSLLSLLAGAQPEEQNTINVLMTIPWSFKLLYGFLSDTYKLFGYRRKSYLLLGYIMYAASMSVLSFIGEIGAGRGAQERNRLYLHN